MLIYSGATSTANTFSHACGTIKSANSSTIGTNSGLLLAGQSRLTLWTRHGPGPWSRINNCSITECQPRTDSRSGGSCGTDGRLPFGEGAALYLQSRICMVNTVFGSASSSIAFIPTCPNTKVAPNPPFSALRNLPHNPQAPS